MRFIDHQPGFVLLLDVHESREIRHVAVGAIHTFDDDQCAPVLRAQLAQEAIGGGKIVVREAQPVRTREQGSLHRAVVQQLVAEHGVARPHEVRDRGNVRRDAADVENAVLDPNESRKLLLELLMDRSLARDDSARRNRRAIAMDGIDHRGVHARIAGESEVVVVREVDQLTSRHQRRTVRRSLVHAEVRVFQSVPLELFEPRLEQAVLREFRGWQWRHEPLLAAPKRRGIARCARRQRLSAGVQGS